MDDDAEEDSGSEVEIIEEIQGRPPPLIESPEFKIQEETHFLQNLSEQEAKAFSNELKTAEEDAVGEVVMVRVGTEGEMDQDEEENQEASYVELKPSTTLLVPLELVEGQGALVNAAEPEPSDIFQAAVPNDLKTESQSSFSLTLDLDEDGDKEDEPNENNLLSTGISQFVVKESNDKPETIPEVEVLENVESDLLDTEILEESDKRTVECPEVDTQRESNEEEPIEETISENTLENQITEDPKKEAQAEKDEHVEHKKTEVQCEEQTLLVPEPVGELSDMCTEKDIQDTAVAEEQTEPSDKPTEPEEPLKDDTLKHNTEDIQDESAEQEGAVLVEAPKETEIEMETKEEKKDSVEKVKDTKKRSDNSQKEEPLVKPEEQVDEASDDQPVLTLSSDRKNRATYTPTRRITRASRMVTFISPVLEEMDDTVEEKNEPEVKKEDEQKAVPVFATSPSRSTRRSKQVQENIISTPRRSTRRTQAEPKAEVESEPELKPEEKVDKVEIVCDNTVSSTTRTVSPARRRASQRTSSTRTSQQSTREEVESNTESEGTQETADTKAVSKSSVRGKTPTKRKAAQSTTPRRSSRRTTNVGEEASQPLEVLEEEVEEQQEPASASPTKQTNTVDKSKSKPALPAPAEDLNPSPARRTRQSSRITLSVYPQVKLVPVVLPQSEKKRGKKGQDQSGPESQSDADALSQTDKVWDQPEEELPLLDPPLEVDSETPVADALIKRLQDEKKRDVSKSMTRSSKRHTKSVVDPEPPVENNLTFNLDNSSPGESSFIYSPSRRRAAVKRAESPHQSDRTAPVTRSRRKMSAADAPQDEMAVEEPQVSNTRKNNKRTKSKPVLEPELIAEVDLLSPLPSPVDPVPRAQKRTKEAEGPTSTMNLRRKRIMDTVLTKPVTRRKRL